MAMMADCVGFQAQIASIIEMLANSAVVEICKLVDDGYASLRSQMDQEREQSEKENDVLRLKIRDMDIKIRSYERKMKRRNQREGMHSVQFRPPEGISAVMPLNEDLQTRGASHATASDDPPFPQIPQEESHALALVKQEREERTDCNLDLKVEVNLRTEEPGEEASPSDRLDVFDSHTSTNQNSSPLHSEATVDLTCRPRTKRKLSKSLGGSSTPGSSGNLTGVGLKPETQVDDTSDQQTSMQSAASTAEEPSPDRLNSLGLDLAWMQERVSHLGAAFAVAQLGLGSTETGHLSSSFPTQADNMEGPPTMLFPGGAHEMAAFAATFDMAAAANAAAAATAATSAPPPAPSNQRRPYRSNAAKEPMVCNVCGRTFPSSAALELHQRVHTGERPYSCQHCGKGFAQPNNLRVHLLIHSGERRYHCSLCGKSFISSSHLRRHRTVHTQEKPYSCARCGQSFSQLCSVRRHRQQSQCGL